MMPSVMSEQLLRGVLQVINNSFYPGAYISCYAYMYVQWRKRSPARVPRMETYRSAVIEALTRLSEACSVRQKQMSIYNE